MRIMSLNIQSISINIQSEHPKKEKTHLQNFHSPKKQQSKSVQFQTRILIENVTIFFLLKKPN